MAPLQVNLFVDLAHDVTHGSIFLFFPFFVFAKKTGVVCVAYRSFGVPCGSVACCALLARATGHALACLLPPPLSSPLSALYLEVHSLFVGFILITRDSLPLQQTIQHL
jgi:hypothetical protein